LGFLQDGGAVTELKRGNSWQQRECRLLLFGAVNGQHVS
jgi:hypothetical protein